jgi:hypothetical protein
MVHRSECHFSADIFTERNQRDTDNSCDLVKRFFFLLLVFSADVHHLLDFQNVATASVCASLNYKLNELSKLFVC